MSLSLIQEEIKKALFQLKDHSRFSEAILAKKIRENTNFEGKKKAGISLCDLENAIKELESDQIYYSLMLNSANDLLIEKSESPKLLTEEVRSRRLKSEKSMTLFTNGDFKANKSDKKNKKMKSDRKREKEFYSDDF